MRTTNRRNFLGMMAGGIAGAAAVRTWPFRVYSFPSEIAISKMALTEFAAQFTQIAGRAMALEYDRIIMEMCAYGYAETNLYKSV